MGADSLTLEEYSVAERDVKFYLHCLILKMRSQGMSFVPRQSRSHLVPFFHSLPQIPPPILVGLLDVCGDEAGIN